MTYIPLSACCKAEVKEDHRYRNDNHRDLVDIYTCTKCEQECDEYETDHDCHLSPEDGCTHESHQTVMGAFAKVQESVEELQDILNRDPLKGFNFPF